MSVGEDILRSSVLTSEVVIQKYVYLGYTCLCNPSQLQGGDVHRVGNREMVVSRPKKMDVVMHGCSFG